MGGTVDVVAINKFLEQKKKGSEECGPPGQSLTCGIGMLWSLAKTESRYELR
jgi:hypothetical protein